MEMAFAFCLSAKATRGGMAIRSRLDRHTEQRLQYGVRGRDMACCSTYSKPPTPQYQILPDQPSCHLKARTLVRGSQWIAVNALSS